MQLRSSYLHSLNLRAASLRLEIERAAARDDTRSAGTAYETRPARSLEQDYHVNVAKGDGLPTPSETLYLGPGSSARLLEHLLKVAVQWHIASNVQLPEHLISDEPSQSAESLAFGAMQSFTLLHDQRRQELHAVVPPSTQRALIDHYLTVVSPEYPLLPTEQDSTLLRHENPLRWSSSNKEDPNTLAFSIVFAISTALISRDLDSNLSSVELRFREDVQKISLGETILKKPVETIRWTCIALCALCVCELVNPTSRLWDLLGRAASTIEDLRDGYRLNNISFDADFERLQYSFLKLERHAVLGASWGCPANLS